VPRAIEPDDLATSQLARNDDTDKSMEWLGVGWRLGGAERVMRPGVEFLLTLELAIGY